MSIRMGRWDCTSCGYVGNPGPETRCTQCGSPRPAKVIFYLANDAELISKREAVEAAKKGADWVCSFCSGHNKADQHNCGSCGNTRNVNDGDQSIAERKYRLDEIPLSSKAAAPKPKLPAKRKGMHKVWKIVLGTLAAILLLILLGIPNKYHEAEIVEHQWNSFLNLQENRLLDEEAWALPDKAFNVTTYEAIHHYDKIPDGTRTETRTVQVQTGTRSEKTGVRDLGNGYFEDIYTEVPVYENREETYEVTNYREVPVYKTKYRYSIYRWVDLPVEELNGTGKSPRLNRDTNVLPAGTRVHNHGYTYAVAIEDKKQQRYTDKVEPEYWYRSETGQRVKIKKSLIYGYYKALVLE